MTLIRLSLLALFACAACDGSDAPSNAAKKSDAKKADADKGGAVKSDAKKADAAKGDAKKADAAKGDARKAGADKAGADKGDGKKAPAGPLAAMRFDPVKAGEGTLPHDPTSDVEDGSPISHVTKWGWTSAGDAFVYCYDDMDAGSCEVQDKDGKQMLSASVEDDAWKTFEKTAGTLGHGPTDWSYGDVTITWAQNGRSLQVGAKVGDGNKPDVIRFEKLDPEDGDAMYFPELVSLSPDRSSLAIVARYAVGEPIQGHHISVVATSTVAGEAYGSAGFAAMNAKKYEDAQGWFDKASAASSAWKHPYNLACARSLGGLDGVEDALREAVKRGGKTASDKANKDKDLAKAREQAWFAAVVGG